MAEVPPDPAPTGQGPSSRAKDPRAKALLDRYWRRNLMLMSGLLAVWLFAGVGCGIVWADTLNTFQWFGYPLGFWFAQQGSIIVFVLLIWVYCMAMNRLDALHHRELKALEQEGR
ncbi:DUF4212 domain-containing protein [Acanthopleuribacter pedis]|uniref:DUF4212 domain-containing protein n=1 Tax=Acanthopleuribacter pedis TaxID=442870 RepID=A0A8J7QB65_9BACT|nr:DUF4212 domain-containing protein [Acanthopleuribacter pedis]MBO1320874.1 DUF4212 domain-containing protein [Acanthopleuribacter pedis]